MLRALEDTHGEKGEEGEIGYTQAGSGGGCCGRHRDCGRARRRGSWYCGAGNHGWRFMSMCAYFVPV